MDINRRTGENDNIRIVVDNLLLQDCPLSPLVAEWQKEEEEEEEERKSREQFLAGGQRLQDVRRPYI